MVEFVGIFKVIKSGIEVFDGQRFS